MKKSFLNSIIICILLVIPFTFAVPQYVVDYVIDCENFLEQEVNWSLDRPSIFKSTNQLPSRYEPLFEIIRVRSIDYPFDDIVQHEYGHAVFDQGVLY